MNIGIIGKPKVDKVYEITAELYPWLVDRGNEVFVEKEIADKIGLENSYKRDEIPDLVDIILVFGGDGTFLGVARLVCQHDIPLLGINVGGLGFLTEITVEELYPMMERILEGDFEVEIREMISASIMRGKEQIGEHVVLNDLVINKGAVSRIIDLEIHIDKSLVNTFKADGIIISTPTGSTAYSLSAGGPIVYPTLPVVIITPICPHTLTNRPLVVPSDTSITVKVLSEDPDTYLTLDGQIGIKLETGDIIELQNTHTSVKVIKSPYRDYFTILKTKLMWGERYEKIQG